MFRAENQAALEAKLAPTVTWGNVPQGRGFLDRAASDPPVVPAVQVPADHRRDAGGGGGRAWQPGPAARWSGPPMTARGEVTSCRMERDWRSPINGSPRCRKTIDAMGRMEAFAPPDKPFST